MFNSFLVFLRIFVAGIGIVGLLVLAGQAQAGERIPRSAKARAVFMYDHPCPSTGLQYGPCPGWMLDHIKPLACGGADAPENMQWQTIGDAIAKDKWERKGCRR